VCGRLKKSWGKAKQTKNAGVCRGIG